MPILEYTVQVAYDEDGNDGAVPLDLHKMGERMLAAMELARQGDLLHPPCPVVEGQPDCLYNVNWLDIRFDDVATGWFDK